MKPTRPACANCGKPYSSHTKTTHCEEGGTAKWFPKSLADALTRQQRKLRKAQRDLAKRHAHAQGDTK